MPYATNQGIRIHYEIEGKGLPLLLQYGQYFPLDIWYELNYVSALKDEFQLILVDARGHGQSDKPHDPKAYQIELMVNDILAVLEILGLESVHYMGYSSGAYLGYGIARYAPHRARTLILGGSYPYADNPPDTTWNDDQVKKLENQTTEEFVVGLEKFLLSQNFPPFSPRMRASMLMHDLQALIAWLKESANWPFFDEIVSAISVPCLIYAGEKSSEYAQAQRAAQEISGATFLGIPNGGHLEGGTWINVLRPKIYQVTRGGKK